MKRTKTNYDVPVICVCIVSGWKVREYRLRFNSLREALPRLQEVKRKHRRFHHLRNEFIR